MPSLGVGHFSNCCGVPIAVFGLCTYAILCLLVVSPAPPPLTAPPLSDSSPSPPALPTSPHPLVWLNNPSCALPYSILGLQTSLSFSNFYISASSCPASIRLLGLPTGLLFCVFLLKLSWVPFLLSSPWHNPPTGVSSQFDTFGMLHFHI
jgi:hypothetical protein